MSNVGGEPQALRELYEKLCEAHHKQEWPELEGQHFGALLEALELYRAIHTLKGLLP